MKRSVDVLQTNVRSIRIDELTGEQIDKRKLPRVVMRDPNAESPLPIDVGGKYLPSEVVCKLVHHVVQSDWHVHARLKSFFALARVCEGLRAACQRARYLPEHARFRREARDWDAYLLHKLYPRFLARHSLVDWRWGADLRLARKGVAVAGPVLRLESPDQIVDLDRDGLARPSELHLEDLGPGLVAVLLKKLGDADLPALRVLRVGMHCTRIDEQTLVAKCPALTAFDGQALPLAIPASLKQMTLAFFNSSGLDGKAWASQASGLRELRIGKLEDDSAGLLKLLAPQLRVLHIADLRALLNKTLADLAHAPLLELELPLTRVPGPDYVALRSVPALFGGLSRLVVRLWLTDTQRDEHYFSDTLKALASMPGLRSFVLNLTGSPAKENFRQAIQPSIHEALRANPDLQEVRVSSNGSMLHDPVSALRALENRCYAPR